MSPDGSTRHSVPWPSPPVLGASTAPGPQSHIGWLWVALAVIALAGLGVLHAFSPEVYGFYPRCGLFTLTGLHCPGCGSLRAIHHLSHGAIGAAIDSNALLVLSLVAGIVWAGARLWRRRLNVLVAPGVSSRAVLLVLLVVLLFGVLRNLPWFPFVLLAP